MQQLFDLIPITNKNCTDIFKEKEFFKLLELSNLPKSTQEQFKGVFWKLRKMSCDGNYFNRDKFIASMKDILNALCNVNNFQ
jgi:hypothetical protein